MGEIGRREEKREKFDRRDMDDDEGGKEMREEERERGRERERK